jgi:rubrerythrin
MGLEGFGFNRRRFRDLSEQEVLALAISSEEDDARIYRSYAERLRADYPDSAAMFDEMAAEEDTHRQRLIELHRARFGEVIPLIRREHVAGYYARRPVWLVENLGLDRIRDEAAAMEQDAEAFYLKAAQRTDGCRHPQATGRSCPGRGRPPRQRTEAAEAHLDADARETEDDRAHRQFVLTWVQPGLAGLMDGSVSTLAPIFATAFATQDTWTTFLVGLAASVGAGISMGFTEAASDDGELSGRGSPRQARFRLGRDDHAGRALATPCPISSPISGPRRSRPSWSSSSNSGRSSGSRTATWRRRSCARHSRWCWAVRWSSRQAR